MSSDMTLNFLSWAGDLIFLMSLNFSWTQNLIFSICHYGLDLLVLSKGPDIFNTSLWLWTCCPEQNKTWSVIHVHLWQEWVMHDIINNDTTFPLRCVAYLTGITYHTMREENRDTSYSVKDTQCKECTRYLYCSHIMYELLNVHVGQVYLQCPLWGKNKSADMSRTLQEGELRHCKTVVKYCWNMWDFIGTGCSCFLKVCLFNSRTAKFISESCDFMLFPVLSFCSSLQWSPSV